MSTFFEKEIPAAGGKIAAHLSLLAETALAEKQEALRYTASLKRLIGSWWIGNPGPFFRAKVDVNFRICARKSGWQLEDSPGS